MEALIPDGYFLCRNCKEEKPIGEERKGSLASNKKAICKKCHCTAVKNDHINKAAEKRPQDFFDCLDCDRTMAVFVNGNKRRIITECKFCGSENLEDCIV